MQKNLHPGKFIVFEGLDGSGQTTQVNLLVNWLSEQQQKVSLGNMGAHLTKEPTSSLIGGLIRSQLYSDWKSGAECLQLLFAADRSYHLEKEVIPLLERGVTVVSDRYLFSSVAYGQAAGIKDEEWLYKINEHALQPDIVILLNTPPKICIQRIRSARHSIAIFEEEAMLQEVWKNFTKIKERHSSIVKTIDGEDPVDRIAENVQTVIKNIFLNK